MPLVEATRHLAPRTLLQVFPQICLKLLTGVSFKWTRLCFVDSSQCAFFDYLLCISGRILLGLHLRVLHVIHLVSRTIYGKELLDLVVHCLLGVVLQLALVLLLNQLDLEKLLTRCRSHQR